MTASAASEPRTAIVVIAHGSRSEEANAAHVATCRRLEARTGQMVLPAFLELTEPSLDAAIASCVAEAASSVAVIPFFLYPGRHVQRDIPSLISAATLAFPEITIRMSALFGDHHLVVDALAAIVDELD